MTSLLGFLYFFYINIINIFKKLPGHHWIWDTLCMLPMITIITNFHTENKILFTKKMDENSEMENNAGEKNTEI